MTTFVMHHPALEYRKKSLINDFSKLQFPYKTVWIEHFPPSLVYNNHKITSGELSLSLKHYHALCMQLETDTEFGFYIEDDIDFFSVPDPLTFINQCIEEMKQTAGDICWVGGTDLYGDHLLVKEPKIENKNLYYNESYTTRCTHGFIVNKKCILTLLDYYHFNSPVDHMMNGVIQSQRLKNSWTSPFFYQKSHSDPDWRSSLR